MINIPLEASSGWPDWINGKQVNHQVYQQIIPFIGIHRLKYFLKREHFIKESFENGPILFKFKEEEYIE